MSDTTRLGDGAGLSILSASAARKGFTTLAQAFHDLTGTGVELRFDTSGRVIDRICGGEAVDVVVGSMDALRTLEERGLLRTPPQAFGASRIALGVRKGEAAPDISTMAAFRAALLNARAFSRGDPAGGGTAGQHLHRVLERMGVLGALADKNILRVGGYNVMAEVAAGRADFGLTQSTEIGPVEGVEIGAWAPEEAQATTVYGAATAGAGRDGEALRAFMGLFAGPQGRAAFADAGFFPPDSV